MGVQFMLGILPKEPFPGSCPLPSTHDGLHGPILQGSYAHTCQLKCIQAWGPAQRLPLSETLRTGAGDLPMRMLFPSALSLVSVTILNAGCVVDEPFVRGLAPTCLCLGLLS